MQVRTQVAIVGLVAAAWGAGNLALVHPVLAEQEHERVSLGTLEAAVARDPSDLGAVRDLAQRYVEMQMYSLAIDTITRASHGVQDDGRVRLALARAREYLGDLGAATTLINAALARCTVIPSELADGAGCDVRTQTELTIEATAIDRMQEWGITPVTDPARANLAHDLATRPVHIAVR